MHAGVVRSGHRCVTARQDTPHRSCHRAPPCLHFFCFPKTRWIHLQAYLENVALTQPGVRRVCLITKARLLGMYASCGFALKGLSPVVHGKDPWFEMAIDLDATEPRLLRFLQVRGSRERSIHNDSVIDCGSVGCVKRKLCPPRPIGACMFVPGGQTAPVVGG